MFNKSSISFLA